MIGRACDLLESFHDESIQDVEDGKRDRSIKAARFGGAQREVPYRQWDILTI